MADRGLGQRTSLWLHPNSTRLKEELDAYQTTSCGETRTLWGLSVAVAASLQKKPNVWKVWLSPSTFQGPPLLVGSWLTQPEVWPTAQ